MSTSPTRVHAAIEPLDPGVPARDSRVVCDFEKSRDAYLHDALTGKEYLDFCSFYGARPLGFNHPRLRDTGFIERLGRIALPQPVDEDTVAAEYVDFVDMFVTVTLQGRFSQVVNVDGRTAAVDCALRAAMLWKRHHNQKAGRNEEGNQVVCFQQAFHGDSGAALALSDPMNERPTSSAGPDARWPRVTNPKMSHPFEERERTEVEALEQASLREIEDAFDRNPHDIAAIIIEPIQGEGGDNYFRSEFLAALRRVCDQRQALLIFDEVDTGLGSTGAWWDWQLHDVQPDILIFGKKTQVYGYATSTRLDAAPPPPRLHLTSRETRIAMVRGQRVVEVIRDEDLIGHAATLGKYLQKLLCELADVHSEMQRVRGRGLWAAFDLPTPGDRDRFVDACFKEQLLVMPVGRFGVGLRPALDIGADAIGRCAAQLEAGLRRAYGKHR